MSEFEEELLKAADEILLAIRNKSLADYFVYGNSKPIPLKVTSRSGQLVQAVIKATTRGDSATVTQTSDGMLIRGEVVSPYAKLIHEGGVRAITPPMRRFFWAKWRETLGTAENKMWSILRFRVTERYEPRQFLYKAINDIANEVPEILRKHAIIGLIKDIKMMLGTERTSTRRLNEVIPTGSL